MEDVSSPQEVSAAEPLWQRFLYMVVFGILVHIAFSLTLFLSVVQLLVLAFTKKKNDDLQIFCGHLVTYIGECLRFLIFATEEKPFPLGKFPS